MSAMIMERNYIAFMEPPPQATISIVKEFYVNSRGARDWVVIVRGRHVSYTPQNINALFHLRDIRENDPTWLYSQRHDLNDVIRLE